MSLPPLPGRFTFTIPPPFTPLEYLIHRQPRYTKRINPSLARRLATLSPFKVSWDPTFDASSNKTAASPKGGLCASPFADSGPERLVSEFPPATASLCVHPKTLLPEQVDLEFIFVISKFFTMIDLEDPFWKQ
jgi:hypothetical protein